MTIIKVTDKIKREIRKKVRHEFPRSKVLQDLHYYRYIKEIEWKNMSNNEIIKDIKNGADEIRKEIETLKENNYVFDKN